MTASSPSESSVSSSAGARALTLSAQAWFVVATAGQWLFAYYVIGYYGGFVARKGVAGLGDSHLPNAYSPGDLMGNLAIAIHLLLAISILVGGPLQLVPAIPRRFPRFHHWNGRLYVVSVLIASLSGLHMVWIRGASAGDFGQHFGLSLNAVLIIWFCVPVIRLAMKRRIAQHRRWAVRLFLAASGVWFARVMLWLWIRLTGGVGVDFSTFTGWFLTALNFAQFLLPLAVYELYLRAQDRGGARARHAMAAGLLLLTLATVLGLHEVATRSWLRRL